MTGDKTAVRMVKVLDACRHLSHHGVDPTAGRVSVYSKLKLNSVRVYVSFLRSMGCVEIHNTATDGKAYVVAPKGERVLSGDLEIAFQGRTPVLRGKGGQIRLPKPDFSMCREPAPAPAPDVAAVIAASPLNLVRTTPRVFVTESSAIRPLTEFEKMTGRRQRHA